MGFGASTDHFGIATADLIVVASDKTPVADSRADAVDENADIAASTFYGAGTLFEASNTYALITSTLDTATILLGELSAGVFAQTAEVSTSSDGWPQVTVSGTLGAETMVAPTGKTNKFALPTFTISARKQAQLMGFTVAATAKLNSSSLSASVELGQQENGLGEPAAHGVSGGTYEITAELVGVTGVPGWTVTSGTETQAPGTSEGQAAYHVGTGTAAGTLVRGTVV